ILDLKKFLKKEEDDAANRMREIDMTISGARNEIASKCTLIIAQAIMDLMAQVEKVGRTEYQSVQRRQATIQHALQNIDQTIEISTRSRLTPDLSNRLSMQKSALASTSQLAGEYRNVKVPKAICSPVMKINYATSCNAIINAIASLGETITANFVTADSYCRKVHTFSTPLVDSAYSKFTELSAHNPF
ncbi:hypothetical protein PFISCL1PPCAC_21535, partial [Pristionchus fissidentatus]